MLQYNPLVPGQTPMDGNGARPLLQSLRRALARMHVQVYCENSAHVPRAKHRGNNLGKVMRRPAHLRSSSTKILIRAARRPSFACHLPYCGCATTEVHAARQQIPALDVSKPHPPQRQATTLKSNSDSAPCQCHAIPLAPTRRPEATRVRRAVSRMARASIHMRRTAYPCPQPIDWSDSAPGLPRCRAGAPQAVLASSGRLFGLARRARRRARPSHVLRLHLQIPTQIRYLDRARTASTPGPR